MAIVFVMLICLTIAVPLTALAWAMKRTHCPNCGTEIGPDPQVMRMLNGD